MNSAAVIIPACKNPVHLSVVLYGYTRQTDPDFTIHVVNDGGMDELQGVVESYQDRLAIHYHYLEPKTEIFRAAAARNVGIRNTTADRLIFMDSDIVPYPNLIALHKSYGQKRIIVLGVRKHVNQGGSQYIEEHVDEFFRQAEEAPDAYCDFLERYTWRDDDRYQYENDLSFKVARHQKFMRANRPGVQIPGICFTHNMSVPTKETKRIGGFWEEFVGYGAEDEDLAARLCKLGCTTYADARIAGYHLWHEFHSTTTNPESLQKNRNRLRESKDMHSPIRNGGPIL